MCHIPVSSRSRDVNTGIKTGQKHCSPQLWSLNHPSQNVWIVFFLHHVSLFKLFKVNQTHFSSHWPKLVRLECLFFTARISPILVCEIMGNIPTLGKQTLTRHHCGQIDQIHSGFGGFFCWCHQCHFYSWVRDIWCYCSLLHKSLTVLVT